MLFSKLLPAMLAAAGLPSATAEKKQKCSATGYIQEVFGPQVLKSIEVITDDGSKLTYNNEEPVCGDLQMSAYKDYNLEGPDVWLDYYINWSAICDFNGFRSCSGSYEGVPYKGRQGAVQLCEHVHVSWSDIEDHVARWQKDRAGDWKACFSCFNIECRDPSHDTRCTAEGTPTWPRARLQAHERDENKVLLTLEWKPHSGLDALTCTAAGQAPAAQLRKVFQKYRQGAGGILFPSGRSSPLPEMACYGPSECTCLYYETGDDKVPNTGGLSKCGGFFQEDWRFRFTSLHRIHRYSFGVLAAKVSTKKHWPCGTDGSVCLVTIYKRQIPVFNKTDLDTRINPGHAWLHAMDPDTYARPSAGLDLPFCKDKECMNYYRRPKAFKCILGGGTLIHDRCTCSSEA